MEEEKDFKNKIKAQAQALITELEVGDMSRVRNAINSLNEIREDSLYNELGRLTRTLHESLKTIDTNLPQEEGKDVQGRLSFVIQLTEQAANTTMDGIEATLPISDALATESRKLHDEWEKLGRRELSLEEFKNLYKTMMQFLNSVSNSSSEIHQHLQKVLVAQNYQDLSGQAIRKVIALVNDVEIRLVQLVALASEASGSSNDNKVEQQAKMESTIVKNQDEVDDLLSSLGF